MSFYNIDIVAFQTALFQLIPTLFVVVIIVIGGYLIASFIGWLLRKTLYRIKIDKWVRKHDLDDTFGQKSIAKIFGNLVRWWIFSLFLILAAQQLHFGVLQDYIQNIVRWLPSLMGSIVTVVLGMLLIDFIIHRILEITSPLTRLIANIIKGFLIIAIAFTVLEQLGIQLDVLKTLFLLLAGAILLTSSLAIGIGLGLGFKDDAKKMVTALRKKLK